MDKEPKLSPPPDRSPAENMERSLMVPSGDERVDGLRADIARTREKAARTIDEIERRLSFTRLKAQMKDRAQKLVTSGKVNIMANQTGETSKRWASAVVDTIKEHPLPSIMIGGGLAWLIASSMGSGESEENSEFFERRKNPGVDETGTYGLGFIERRRSSITDFKESSGGRAAKIKSGFRDKARRAKDRASQLSEQVRQKTSQTASQAREGLSDWKESASEYGQRMRESVSERGERAGNGFFNTLQEHPLAIAGVLLAAGAVAGLVIPESRYEEKKLGQTRDRMLDQAREKGQETLRKAESVAREAVESAKDEADRQGLLHREKADRAEDKVRSAAEDLRDESEKKAQQWGEEVEKF